jgi:hypothetical protein
MVIVKLFQGRRGQQVARRAGEMNRLLAQSRILNPNTFRLALAHPAWGEHPIANGGAGR